MWLSRNLITCKTLVRLTFWYWRYQCAAPVMLKDLLLQHNELEKLFSCSLLRLIWFDFFLFCIALIYPGLYRTCFKSVILWRHLYPWLIFLSDLKLIQPVLHIFLALHKGNPVTDRIEAMCFPRKRVATSCTLHCKTKPISSMAVININPCI